MIVSLDGDIVFKVAKTNMISKKIRARKVKHRYMTVLRKKLFHHEERPQLFSSTVGPLRRGRKYRSFFVSDAPFSRYDNLKFL